MDFTPSLPSPQAPVASVRYTVTAEPRSHRFRVRCTVSAPAAGQVFRLPAWIRGSYLVRDFAKHIVDIGAFSGEQRLVVTRLDKSSLRVEGVDPQQALVLEYSVHAYDNSVRKAFLDTRRGFFNGSSLFYRADGCERSPHEVDLIRPDPALCPRWRVATAMTAVAVDGDGFGLYAAPDYETLIDHPVEMSDFERLDFTADGVPHSFALSGRFEVDGGRLCADVARICAAQRRMFGSEPALPHYWFLTQVTGNGYGGLEHRASTALVTTRDALPRRGQQGLRKGYRGFLGLVSHEYFHLWNVKRITPAPFAESDLSREAYSRDLWAYEGATSYYDDLFLLRAGLIDPPAYLDLLAENATRLQRTPGRRLHSLADASFEAWIKYYQPDENTPNQTVSYYVKGALAALCVDLRLRRDTPVTLDDVMRTLWQRYGRSETPAPEGALEAVAGELAGSDLRPFFDWLLRSTDDLPLAELLADFGVDARLRASTGAGDEGGRSEARTPAPPWLGINLKADGSVAHVLADSPAERAGLAGGDVLVALDGLRVNAGNWSKLLDGLHVGSAVALHWFRGDELMHALITPDTAPQDTWTLTLAEASGTVLERRRKWLGS